MKKLLRTLAIVLLLFAYSGAYSQVLDVEKTYEITGKSKRGSLAKVEFDQATGEYTLYYVTKSSDKMVKFQVYKFDKDFNFINLNEEEVELEKAKTKYTWFDFRGELYSVEGVFVEPNLVGTLVLKRKKITYKYDWWFLGYYKETDILEKVKPKTDDGRVFFYYTHVENDKTGEVYILCGVKDKVAKNADPNRFQKEFCILKYNNQLELVKETTFKFDYPQGVTFARSINDSDDPETAGVAAMAVVFAPLGGPGMNKVADPDNTNYTYIRIDKDANVAERIPFKSFASYWKIDELIHERNSGDVYLFGPAAAGKDKYYNLLLTTTKYKAVQLMKISNGKVAYFTETALEEFKAKIKTPPSQRKTPDYEGKKFEIANYHIAPNGDFLVVGQNFDVSKEGYKYNDVLAFHFDGNGKLKSEYSVDPKESNKFSKATGTPQFFIDGNQNNLFWFLQEIKALAPSKGKLLTYPSVTQIDLNTGSIKDFQVFGADDKYYLDVKYPYLETSKGNTVVFFGSDKSGKTIWFARIALK